jgi:hypothetical protein
MHRFTGMPEDKANGSSTVIELEQRIFGCQFVVNAVAVGAALGQNFS